jgi:hypothetical protein
MSNLPPNSPPPGEGNVPPDAPPPGSNNFPPQGYGPPPGYQQQPPPGYYQQPPPGYQQQPPPGYYQQPPPGYYPQQQYAPPPRKKGLPGWACALIILLPIITIVACVGIFLFSTLGVLAIAKGEVEKQLDVFMKEAAQGDVSAMYALSDRSMTPQEFEQKMKQQILDKPYIKNYKSIELDWSIDIVERGNRSEVGLKGKIRYTDGKSSNFRLILASASNSGDTLKSDSLRLFEFQIDPPS